MPIIRSTQLYIQLQVLSTNIVISCYRGRTCRAFVKINQESLHLVSCNLKLLLFPCVKPREVFRLGGILLSESLEDFINFRD
jgi:hypothetical protein